MDRTSDSSEAANVSRNGSQPGLLLRELVRSGYSFSGRERNCCFLNLRDGRFANTSVASGLNLPDDARGAATVDWDHDGDLDVWFVNRSGPQVRFMSNEHQSQSQSVTIKLQGTSTNRDAIGARVELKLEGESLQVQTVHAGGGYLSQSTKWVHFGTGANRQIEFVKVRWPDNWNAAQEFRGMKVGERYRLTQGEAEPTELPTELRTVLPTELPTATLREEIDRLAAKSESVDAASRVLLTEPIPLPRLYARTLDGTVTDLSQQDTQVTLVNLWATWCQPCLEEIAEFKKRYEELRSAGISVSAVSVDNVDLSHRSAADQVVAALRKMQSTVPFAITQADNRLLDQLQVVHDNLLDLHEPLPIPSSFLLDRSGQLLAIYKGPIDVDQLIRDLQSTNQSSIARRDAALPFVGKWSVPPRSPRLLKLTLDLLKPSDLAVMNEFIRRNQTELVDDSSYPVLLFNIGQQHTRRGEHRQAVEMYKEAVRQRPTMAPAYYNLGVTFAGTKQFSNALICFEQAEKHEPGQLDTRLALARTLTNLDRESEAIELLEATAQIHPSRRTIQLELAIALARSGRVSAAIENFKTMSNAAPANIERDTKRFKSACEIGLEQVDLEQARELRRILEAL